METFESATAGKFKTLSLKNKKRHNTMCANALHCRATLTCSINGLLIVLRMYVTCEAVLM